MNLPDKQLVNLVIKGDGDALNQLFDTHMDRLYNFIFYRVGQNDHDAQDILQQTCLSALDSLSSFKGDSSLYTWLCAIAKHKIHDFVTKKRTGGSAVISDEKDNILDQKISPQENELSEDQRYLVGLILTELPSHYQDVLVAKYIKQLSVREIAESMKQSEKAIESLLTRSRNAFKKIYEEFNRTRKES